MMIAWYGAAILAITGELLVVPELFMAHDMLDMIAIVLTVVHLLQHTKCIKALATKN